MRHLVALKASRLLSDRNAGSRDMNESAETADALLWIAEKDA
jgi:hypothetical protein